MSFEWAATFFANQSIMFGPTDFGPFGRVQLDAYGRSEWLRVVILMVLNHQSRWTRTIRDEFQVSEMPSNESSQNTNKKTRKESYPKTKTLVESWKKGEKRKKLDYCWVDLTLQFDQNRGGKTKIRSNRKIFIITIGPPQNDLPKLSIISAYAGTDS